MDHALRVAERYLRRLVDEDVGGYLSRVTTDYDRFICPDLRVTLEFAGGPDCGFIVDYHDLGPWVIEPMRRDEFAQHVSRHFDRLCLDRQFERELEPYRRNLEALYHLMAPAVMIEEAQRLFAEAREDLSRRMFAPRRSYFVGMDMAATTDTMALPEPTTVNLAQLSQQMIEWDDMPEPRITASQQAQLARQADRTFREMLYGDLRAAHLGTPFRTNDLYNELLGPTVATTKAQKLLKEWLSPAQLAQYEKHGHFEVKGGTSGKTYRIRPCCSMNVDEIGDGGSEVETYCFTPEGRLEVGDIMLAQKIALECNEEAALAVANKRSEANLHWNFLFTQPLLRPTAVVAVNLF